MLPGGGRKPPEPAPPGGLTPPAQISPVPRSLTDISLRIGSGVGVKWGLIKNRLTVAVFGCSRGARTINTAPLIGVDRCRIAAAPGGKRDGGPRNAPRPRRSNGWGKSMSLRLGTRPGSVPVWKLRRWLPAVLAAAAGLAGT